MIKTRALHGFFYGCAGVANWPRLVCTISFPQRKAPALAQKNNSSKYILMFAENATFKNIILVTQKIP